MAELLYPPLFRTGHVHRTQCSRCSEHDFIFLCVSCKVKELGSQEHGALSAEQQQARTVCSKCMIRDGARLLTHAHATRRTYSEYMEPLCVKAIVQPTGMAHRETKRTRQPVWHLTNHRLSQKPPTPTLKLTSSRQSSRHSTNLRIRHEPQVTLICLHRSSTVPAAKYNLFGRSVTPPLLDASSHRRFCAFLKPTRTVLASCSRDESYNGPIRIRFGYRRRLPVALRVI